jgi:hypothetical protein
MKIYKNVIKAIRENPRARARLMYELGISNPTVYILLQNADDNDLTKARAVKAIADELNIPEEGIITENGELSKEQFELVKSIYEKQDRVLDECFKCETN